VHPTRQVLRGKHNEIRHGMGSKRVKDAKRAQRTSVQLKQMQDSREKMEREDDQETNLATWVVRGTKERRTTETPLRALEVCNDNSNRSC